MTDSRKQKALDQLFPDRADFTPAHDEMFFWLQKNANQAATEAYRLLHPNALTGMVIKGKLQGQPVLEGQPPAFPDAVLTGKLSRNTNNVSVEARFFPVPITVVFEIKPRLDSFGNVMRQLRLYETRLDRQRAWWSRGEELVRDDLLLALVTPESKWDEEFLQENVAVIHPPQSGGR